MQLTSISCVSSVLLNTVLAPLVLTCRLPGSPDDSTQMSTATHSQVHDSFCTWLVLQSELGTQAYHVCKHTSGHDLVALKRVT